MPERPGANIGAPRQEHQVGAMLYLLSCAQSKEEALVTLRGLEWTVAHLWGWEPEVFKAELLRCEEVMREYQGKTSFWFTESGMEFDYDCRPPATSSEH